MTGARATTPEEIADLARRCRIGILQMVYRAGASHVGSALSVIDVLCAIHAHTAADSADQDAEVILSKGHAATALYALLAETGRMPAAELESYGTDGSRLWGHVSLGVPGVSLSTGSLGHGLPFGAGVALATRRLGAPIRVFVVMSDGELQEGTTWETALFAAHHQLSNLTVVIDRNGLQSITSTEETLALEPLPAKWASFGWDVANVDGHDHMQLLEEFARDRTQPTCVIAETVKGKGVSFMEGGVEWHYRPPSPDELDVALGELR